MSRKKALPEDDMRLQFRNQGQADQYWKICRKILKGASHGPEGATLRMQRTRNLVYRCFGYNHFPDFERNFVPDHKVIAWFHSEEVLANVFSRALNGAMELAAESGFEFTSPAEELVKLAVNAALEANDCALQTLISRQTVATLAPTSGRQWDQGRRGNTRI
jgi:hypothetical protein